MPPSKSRDRNAPLTEPYSRPAAAASPAPAPSISSAMACASREVVPRRSICAVKFATPFWFTGSRSTPAGTRS